MKKESYKSRDVKDEFLKSLEEYMMVIVYDCETTGLSVTKNHIIQVSARKCFVCEDGLEEIERRNWYINPGYALLEQIVKLTGITDELLKDKPFEADVIEEIVEFFDTNPVVGYNNKIFDDKFFAAMFERYGYSFEPEGSVDVYLVVKNLVDPGESENRKLPTITEFWGLLEELNERYAEDVMSDFSSGTEEDGTEIDLNPFHNARGDTIATLLCFNKCVELCRERLQEEYLNQIHCTVNTVSYWANPRNWKDQRIYVETDSASFWFDVLNHAWKLNSETGRISQYDMEDVVSQVLELVDVEDEEALSRFKGRVNARKTQ